MTTVLLDPISALGVELKRPIPKGDAFVTWIRTDAGFVEVVSALQNAGFTWQRTADILVDLSRQEWSPYREATRGKDVTQTDSILQLDGGEITRRIYEGKRTCST